MTELAWTKRSHPDSKRFLAIALAAIVIGGTIDLVLDKPQNWLSFHVLFEIALVVGAPLMASAVWRRWWRAESSLDEMRSRLDAQQAERDAWRANAQKALHGLGVAIDTQFRAWALTPAEREVALLLLKGYSHKRVAQVTGRSERTARQHATTVYGKAGFASRAEPAAFFLEDVLLPEEKRKVAMVDLEAGREQIGGANQVGS